jgi:hypothetical protein
LAIKIWVQHNYYMTVVLAQSAVLHLTP